MGIARKVTKLFSELRVVEQIFDIRGEAQTQFKPLKLTIRQAGSYCSDHQEDNSAVSQQDDGIEVDIDSPRAKY